MSDVAKLCDFDDNRIAEHSCRLCGRRVCKAHFDHHTGLCESCKSGRNAGRGAERPKGGS
jgi:hypothetical protein